MGEGDEYEALIWFSQMELVFMYKLYFLNGGADVLGRDGAV